MSIKSKIFFSLARAARRALRHPRSAARCRSRRFRSRSRRRLALSFAAASAALAAARASAPLIPGSSPSMVRSSMGSASSCSSRANRRPSRAPKESLADDPPADVRNSGNYWLPSRGFRCLPNLLKSMMAECGALEPDGSAGGVQCGSSRPQIRTVVSG